MDTLGLSHGCDATPDNGAQTRCGQTVGNGVVAFGPLWHRVQLDILRANEPSFGEPCPTCFPLPSPLQCPCCEREVTREQYDLACAELAKAARAAVGRHGRLRRLGLRLDMLDLAVPVAIEEVRHWTPERRLEYCHANADIIASQSDTLMFGGKKGEPARLFAILARALACLAFQPGGVRNFAGRRWEAQPERPDPPLPKPPKGPPPRI